MQLLDINSSRKAFTTYTSVKQELLITQDKIGTTYRVHLGIKQLFEVIPGANLVKRLHRVQFGESFWNYRVSRQSTVGKEPQLGREIRSLLSESLSLGPHAVVFHMEVSATGGRCADGLAGI